MLVRLSPRQRFEILVSQFEPIVRAAFIEAIDDIRSNITLRRIVERLERGDIQGAIAAMHLEAEAFNRLEVAIVDAYNRGGQAAVDQMSTVRDPDGNRVVFRWGVRNLPTEAEIRAHAAQMVTRVTADQIDGIRETLAKGMARGDNPWTTARLVVGARNRVTGKRDGGYIGLTAQQMKTADWIKQAMVDGDVDGLRRYLGLKLRDKRFDRSIIAAINAGKPVSAESAAKAVAQYANRALDFRGKVLARHETLTAIGKSRVDAFRQQIAAGKLQAVDVTKAWRHTPREHPRAQHIAMNGQVVPFDQPFIAPDGTALDYPLDPNAPASHTIGCMCFMDLKIDYIAGLKRRHGFA